MLPFVRRAIRAACVVLGILVVVVGSYLLYLDRTWSRLDDGMAVDVQRAGSEVVEVGTSHTVVTYNLGFCAAGPNYTYYRATGLLVNGKHTEGKHAVTLGLSGAQKNLDAFAKTLADLNPDFVLAQSVDRDSIRSQGTDQVAGLADALPGLGYAYALDWHTPFLAYPPNEPQGEVTSGLLTMGRARVAQATRVSLPTQLAFPSKFLEPDACLLVERVPASDGRELVLVNVHTSDYDVQGSVRARQLDGLFAVMRQEAQAGNYVIAGGSLNTLLGPEQVNYHMLEAMPSYLGKLDTTPLPEGISFVEPDNVADVATMRSLDLPYVEDGTYRCTSDGFLVSANVRATAHTVDTGFASSNHNPVQLTFELVSQS